MSKELPYLKFFTSEYLNGSITLCSLEAQGLFCNMMARYWHQDNLLTLEEIKKRVFLGDEIYEKLVNELKENRCIKITDNDIEISFLDEQREERLEGRKGQVRGGRKGGLSKAKGNLKQPSSIKIRKDKIRKEEDNSVKGFELFWSKYPKKLERKSCLSKWYKLTTSEHQEILNTLENFLAYKPFPEYNHPNPLTYLNKQRWKDEFPKPKKLITKIDPNNGTPYSVYE